MTLEIRRDWSPLVDLCHVELAAAERYREVGYDPAAWPSTTAQDFTDYRDRGLLWVAVLGGHAVGFALADLYGNHTHLEEIDVAPDMQGRDVGAALVRNIIAEAMQRESSAITLRTFATTPWSIRLYEKMGFRRWDPDPIPGYLQDIIDDERRSGLLVEHRLSMRLDLGP